MTRREAITNISEAGTHTYFTPEFAKDVQIAFGMRPHTQKVKANTRDPKGLFVEGLGANAVVEGYASHDLTEDIAAHLGLHGAWEQMSGRGFRQRTALSAIDAYLTEKGE